jgi:hypothetical protein
MCIDSLKATAKLAQRYPWITLRKLRKMMKAKGVKHDIVTGESLGQQGLGT